MEDTIEPESINPVVSLPQILILPTLAGPTMFLRNSDVVSVLSQFGLLFKLDDKTSSVCPATEEDASLKSCRSD